MASPWDIQIIVTSGDPDGVRVVEKSNWTGRGDMFARADLGAAREQGPNSPGVYVLLGDDTDEEYDRQMYVGQIYVGQGDDLGKRLRSTSARRQQGLLGHLDRVPVGQPVAQPGPRVVPRGRADPPRS